MYTTELLTTPAVVDPTHDDGGHHGGGTSGDSSLAYTGGDLGALGVGMLALRLGDDVGANALLDQVLPARRHDLDLRVLGA